MRSRTFIIKDPEVAKLLADKTRRHILRILSHHEQSATDLAKRLDKNHSSISHHLHQMLQAGLIEVTRTEQVRNMLQPFYRSVSHNFHVSYSLTEALSEDPDFSEWQDDFIEKMMEGLQDYNILIPEGQKPRVKELLKTSYLLEKKAYEERLQKRKGNRRIGRSAQRNIAIILSHINLYENPEYEEAIKELSQLLGQWRTD